MSRTTSSRTTSRMTKIAAGAAMLLTAAGSTLALAPHADAATQDNIHGKGKVIARTSLAEHTGPSTSAPHSGKGYKKGTVITLDCNLNGTSAGGNDVWYKIQGKHSWVSARYVKNVGNPPIACTAANVPVDRSATATASLTERKAPTTHDRSTGHVAKGKKVQIWCKVASQTIGGNHTWYQTSNDWVSAKYVKTTKSVPYCSQG